MRIIRVKGNLGLLLVPSMWYASINVSYYHSIINAINFVINMSPASYEVGMSPGILSLFKR